MERNDPTDSVREIRRFLLSAYDEAKRELPWREETDPYRVWVSEIMLQQTRVETVIPYYKEWVKRFPDLESLAASEEDEVLKLWQGLGYYSRARNLRRGAMVVRERFGGDLPGSASELMALPGVGEYTAGAVASISFGEVVPAVDGNVRRVLSRLFDLPDPGARELRALASELVDPSRPGDFNQALMEHGALVCKPRSPACGGCPLGGVCQGLHRGTVSERPVKKVRKPVPEVDILVLVAVEFRADGHRFFLRKRPDRGLLARMWEFPGVEFVAKIHKDGKGRSGGVVEVPAGTDAYLRALAEELEFSVVGDPTPLPMVPHGFTHLKARYWPLLCVVQGGWEPSGRRGKEAGVWMTPGEVESLPLPVAQGGIARMAFDLLGARGFPPSADRSPQSS
jgi:A/G-specific adenine glycosylase